ncbi:MAG: hypothetical protein WAW26_21465 [Anaerolineae bacterium]
MLNEEVGRGRWFGQALQVVSLPNIPYTDRGGSGPVDDVGGPGG